MTRKKLEGQMDCFHLHIVDMYTKLNKNSLTVKKVQGQSEAAL